MRRLYIVPLNTHTLVVLTGPCDSFYQNQHCRPPDLNTKSPGHACSFCLTARDSPACPVSLWWMTGLYDQWSRCHVDSALGSVPINDRENLRSAASVRTNYSMLNGSILALSIMQLFLLSLCGLFVLVSFYIRIFCVLSQCVLRKEPVL